VWVDLWLGAGACARQSRLHDASGVRAGWHGWATATLSDGDNSIEVTASYLTDALGDLSRAVIALLRGASNARVVWAEEPGEYHWVFDRLDDRVALRVLWFLNRASTVSDERGTTVFNIECRLNDLAGQLESQLRGLLESLGSQGYEEAWVRHLFPLAEYEQLRGLI
jgi:hypothetical protein